MAQKKPKCLNIYGGPGIGKSILAAGLFYELKLRGFSVEYVQEYAKDATWEKRGPKVFAAQQYIFGKQSFRISRVADEVDFVITDGPIMLGLVYTSEETMPGLRSSVIEHYSLYENVDVLLTRSGLQLYEAKGRNQDLTEAKALDVKVKAMLDQNLGPYGYNEMVFDRSCVNQVMAILRRCEWLDQPTKRMPRSDWQDDWVVDVPRADDPHHKLTIQSNYGEHDEQIKLEVNGNFGHHTIMREYAEGMALVLNEQFSGVRPWGCIRVKQTDGEARPGQLDRPRSARAAFHMLQSMGYKWVGDKWEKEE